MGRVIDMHTKEQLFSDWWKEVAETNFKHSAPKNALLIWTGEDGLANHCRYNCDKSTMEWYSQCLNDKVEELRFDSWIREHLDEYIEYLNN